MPRVPRPQRTLLPGLGVAGAVLSAVMLASLNTGAIVTFNLFSGDPRPGPSTTIVLTGPASSPPTRTPLARVRPSVAAEKPVARARAPAPAPAVRSRVQRPIVVAQIIREERTALPPATPQPPSPPPRQAPAPARPGPLAPVGDVVVQTATGLARTLRSATTGLGNTVAPLSPPLGEVVAAVGDVLGDTVDATGNLLGDLLRPSAPT